MLYLIVCLFIISLILIDLGISFFSTLDSFLYSTKLLFLLTLVSNGLIEVWLFGSKTVLFGAGKITGMLATYKLV
jgi:hypothetical protein